MKTLSLVLLLSISLFCQTLFEPLGNRVYKFLERMNLKEIIVLNDEALPLSRILIAEKLTEIGKYKHKLNNVELDELRWFEKEFFQEISRLNAIEKNNAILKTSVVDFYSDFGLNLFLNNDSCEDRIRLFGFMDSVFSLNISPRGGYQLKYNSDKNGHSKWWGLRLTGTYDKVFSAFFDYMDKGEYGNNIDRNKNFLKETSFFINNAGDSRIEFSDMRGGFTLDWQWGTLSLQKDYVNWGHGQNGQLILSSKAASFPHIYLTLQPTDWFRFYYIHGFLNSLVIDSSASYYNHWDNEKPFLRKEYVGKYFAANQFTFTPFSDFDISLGNIFVYSGRLRPEMFIPFIYYKVMDHNTARGAVDDGNGFLFFDISMKYPKTFKFYTTVLMDVLEIRDILNGVWHTSWFGFTLGAKKVDFMIPNLDISMEYTRINPWLYEHKDETTTYKHINFVLGHWIGQNADNIMLRLDYQPISRFDISLYLQNFRKGGLKDIYNAYQNAKTKQEFLYSPIRKDFSVGLSLQYELIHELFIKSEYIYSSVTDEDSGRNLSFMLGNQHSFSFEVSYGF